MTNNEELALFQALGALAPYLIRERALFADVNTRLYTTVSYDAFRALLIRQKERGRVDVVESEDGPKWSITDAGWLRFNQIRGGN